MTKIADDVFSKTNLSPSYIYLLIVVYQYPGITQKELCDKLSIAPSTSTRFINKLEKLNLVYRRLDWKETHIHLSEKELNAIPLKVRHSITKVMFIFNFNLRVG